MSMNFVIAVQVDVTPGNMKTRDEIKADLLENILAIVNQSGFDYGDIDYTVNSASELNERPTE